MKIRLQTTLLLSILFFTLSCNKENTEESQITEKLTTMDISGISYCVANCGGILEPGVIVNSKGLCWNTTGDPTHIDDKIYNFENDSVSFNSKIFRLKPNTTYYIRAFARRLDEYYYGETKQFKTLGFDSIIDERDSNTYRYAHIGEKYWLIDNLKYLPSINNPTEVSDTIPMYYIYDYYGNDLVEAKNHPNYKNHGVLYNLKSVEESCPNGWHVPSKDDWMELKAYIENIESPRNYNSSTILRSQGTIDDETGLWNSHEPIGINSIGFTATPSGYRNLEGLFEDLNNRADYWMNKYDEYNNYGIALIFDDNSDFMIYFNPEYMEKDIAVAIRCIKD